MNFTRCTAGAYHGTQRMYCGVCVRRVLGPSTTYVARTSDAPIACPRACCSQCVPRLGMRGCASSRGQDGGFSRAFPSVCVMRSAAGVLLRLGTSVIAQIAPSHMCPRTVLFEGRCYPYLPEQLQCAFKCQIIGQTVLNFIIAISYVDREGGQTDFLGRGIEPQAPIPVDWGAQVDI